MKISFQQRQRGGPPAFAGDKFTGQPRVSVVMTHSELRAALRTWLKLHGCELPPGEETLQRASGGVELIVEHNEDDWTPSDHGECVDDAF